MLLLMMALAAIGHGALSLSLRELQATWALRHMARAEMAANLGIAHAWRLPPDTARARTPWSEELVVEGRTTTGLFYRGIRRWIDTEFFLLEGVGNTEGWIGERRVGWIAWALSPSARVRSFFSVSPTAADEAVSRPVSGLGEELLAVPEGWPPGECAALRGILDSHSGGAVSQEVAPARLPSSSGGVAGAQAPSLGLLPGPLLLSLAERVDLDPSLSPPTGVSRGCPPGDLPVFLGSAGDVHLRKGRHCGLLVAAGNLILSGNARFQGLALLGGDLILENRANFEGVARARNRFFQTDSASFRRSVCPVFRALSKITALHQPVLVKGSLPGLFH